MQFDAAGQTIDTIGVATDLGGGSAADTTIPTQLAVKTYVDTQITETGGSLNFAGDSGSGSVDLSSQTLTIEGTTNEINTIGSGTTITLGLPDDVTVTQDLAVGRNVNITGIATANEYDSLSDVRLKRGIKTLDNALNKVREINGVEYIWKSTGEKTIGVIAQQVEEIYPELVRGDDTLSVNYNGFIGVLIESVKELKLRVEELEAKLEEG